MKILAVILSILTITSSVFSFGDELFVKFDEHNSDSSNIEVANIHEDHHKDSVEHNEHHEDKNHSDDNGCEDECHFCFCTCLAHNLINPVFKIEYLTFKYSKSKKHSIYDSFYSNNYLDTILQPPQV